MDITNEMIDKSTVKLTVEAPDAIKEKLSGEFILEMAKQLTREIERAMSIEGLPESNIELKLVFDPQTFMEHTSENVTYRRLLMTDKACGVKDFWVKWTRNNGAVAFSICDAPKAGEITFELGEDVPQKIREREYRFLVRNDTDKYHYAMGRKNITEWREMIKRAIKRGDLTRVVSELEIADHSSDVHDKLSSLLSSFGVSTPSAEEVVTEKDESSEFEEAMRKAQEAVFGQYSDTDEESEEQSAQDVPFDFSAIVEDGAVDFAATDDDEAEMEIEDLAADDGVDTVELDDTLEDEPEEADEEIGDYEQNSAPEAQAPNRSEYDVAAAECEALKKELNAVNEELDRLNQENSLIMAENQRLKRLVDSLTEQKDRLEAEKAEEERRLREEIEARTRAENRERERLEEAARIAVIEQRRIEEERLEAERKAAEELRLAEENARREEEARRIEAERAKEAERIRRETEIARGNIPADSSDAEPAVTSAVAARDYTYVSRKVKLLFKNLIDPNITSRIYEIIKTTVEYYKKENVSIRIKALVPDEKTVVLDFVRIPQEENELFISIIKVLGNSNLGITKAIVE